MADRKSATFSHVSLEAYFNPASVAEKSLADWDGLLREARRLNILTKLAWRLRTSNGWERFPAQARDHITAACTVAERHQRMVHWEVDRIRRALLGMDVPLVVLKGGAYILADLPAGQGRKVNDVDILVPKERIEEVERALLVHGWEPMKLDPYDQRYYRTWMHEIPPLRHRHRQTIVDVHHAILPESGRLRPPRARLWEGVRKTPTEGVMVLSPEDMVLHSAAHLFQDGDLNGGLRDLLDIDDLLRHFGEHEIGFWDRLVPRARQLNLHRPLFYALRYAGNFLRTPIPNQVLTDTTQGRPWILALWTMDALARRALLPGRRSRLFPTLAAHHLLYVRAHWLRMPPLLLARHLAYKTLRLACGKDDSS